MILDLPGGKFEIVDVTYMTCITKAHEQMSDHHQRVDHLMAQSREALCEEILQVDNAFTRDKEYDIAKARTMYLNRVRVLRRLSNGSN